MATFAIDPAHTDVLFSAKHMMVTTVRGTFTDVRGSIDLDEADPTASHAEFVIAAASVDTGFGARDNHLDRPTSSTPRPIRRSASCRPSIRPRGGNDYVVTADVTIRDVTKSVDFDVEFLGFYTGMDGARRAGFSARTKVNRKDWGLDWNVALEAGGWLVGDQIKIEAEIALQEAIAKAA